jgi:catechol 2,3-dioxygenase-like lactoylglutathione lyase family enzyme
LVDLGIGRVDFVAVPVSDLNAADEFYGHVLGLARNPGSGERWVEYETGNVTIGLSTFGGGIALRVRDVGAARRALEETGVAFQMETFDSGVCNGAPFQDPDGNHLLLHRRYAPAAPFDPPAGEVERTDFIGVEVSDRERAGEFYGETLGLERNPLAGEEWPEFSVGNVGFLLSTPEQKGQDELRPEPVLALRVADVAEAMERLSGRGVRFELPELYDTGVCHMAFFSDPDGNGMILHHRYAPYRDGSLPDAPERSPA